MSTPETAPPICTGCWSADDVDDKQDLAGNVSGFCCWGCGQEFEASDEPVFSRSYAVTWAADSEAYPDVHTLIVRSSQASVVDLDVGDYVHLFTTGAPLGIVVNVDGDVLRLRVPKAMNRVVYAAIVHD